MSHASLTPSFGYLGSFRLSTSPEDPQGEHSIPAARSFRRPGLHLELYANGEWTLFETEKSILALSGEAYWDDERLTVERLAVLLKGNSEIPANLDGSFLLLIIDLAAGVCAVCIDRTASKKVFFRSVGAGWIISNGLKIAAYPTSSLDAGALAAYLLNGIPLGGQTLFRDVHVLPEGTIARLTSGDLDIKPYWSYEIDESFEGRSERKLVAEFGELLFSGISARLRQDPRAMFLSLSGGYDSTCILASALRVLGPKNIRAFSYETRDARTTDADAKIAAEVCRHWKVDHRTIQIPTRSLSEIVESNARHAFATANPCLELAVWETLDQSLGFTSGTPRLFFGDNAFGHDPNWRLSTREDAMAWLPMPMLDDFNQLRPFLKDTEFEPTKNSFAEVLGKVLQRGATVYDPMNVKDFFYFDQRVPYALTSWRERFCGLHGQPVNPLLDARVLDFYRHVPREYRRRRKLYRMTVEAMYPEFLQRKRATSQGSSLSIRSLLQADAAWVQERIQSLHPELTEVASVESIGVLLRSLTGPAPTAPKRWKALARRLFKNTTLGEATRSYFPRSRYIERELILLRLLIADASLKMIAGSFQQP